MHDCCRWNVQWKVIRELNLGNWLPRHWQKQRVLMPSIWHSYICIQQIKYHQIQDEIWYHIWIHCVKCIQMSTNMPSIGIGNLSNCEIWDFEDRKQNHSFTRYFHSNHWLWAKCSIQKLTCQRLMPLCILIISLKSILIKCHRS